MSALTRSQPLLLSAAPAAWALALVCAGCAPAAEHPGGAIDAYAEAVKARDVDRVFAMLDANARMDMDEAAFADYFEAHYDLILEQALELEAGAATLEATVEAQVPLSEQRWANLTWHDGVWYVAEASPTGASQQTPRETLTAFVAALERKDLDSLLTLLSRNRRGAIVGELGALQETIAASLDGGIVTRGDRAVLRLDNGDQVTLVREEGEWRIEGFERGRR